MEMEVGDQLKVTADKSIRYPEKNTYEAVGNVVIIHKNETIYGEKATFFMNNLEVEIKGNVRYIGKDITMYGQEMNYNINSKQLTIRNARIVTGGYFVVAEWATKISSEVILARDAEYTTCKDCPESWSMYGKKVRITLRQYIHIQNALIKSNGVPILYFPYMVLPIKKGRQTGFLFPQFSLSFIDGFKYRQPWFWAINDNSDLTLTPGSIGKRGFANDLEYRHILGENKWFEIHSWQANDRYYVPPNIDIRASTDRNNPSGTHYIRYSGSYEHHFQFRNSLTHHLYFVGAREMDIFSDYYQYLSNRLLGPDLPFHTFFNLRGSLADINLEFNYNKNMIYYDPKGFDHLYVQTLPRVSLSLPPWPLFYSKFPFLYNASLGGEFNYNFFKQNHVDHDEKLYPNDKGIFTRTKLIRNANRLEANPYIKWTFGRIGPVTFDTKIKSENVFYHFPYESDPQNKRFTKRGTLFVSNAFFEIEKIYNTGYIEKIPVEQIENRDEIIVKSNEDDVETRVESKNPQCSKCFEKTPSEDKLFSTSKGNEFGDGEKDYMLGNLPKLEGSYIDETYSLVKGGYRHSIFVDLRHHYISDQKYWGNTTFEEQIRSSAGLFDYLDAPRELVHIIGSNETQTDIPQRNTIELIVDNNIFKKTPNQFDYNKDGSYVKNNFSYSSIANFKISQGLTLRTGEPKFVDNLTRLFVSSNFTLGYWGIGVSDYHFYKSKKDIFELSLSRNFSRGSFSLNWKYNNKVLPGTPAIKAYSIAWSLNPLDTVKLSGTYDYDMVVKQYTKATYFATYSPINNCWKLELAYAMTPNDTHREILFNFYLNYGENVFTPLSRPLSN